MPDEADYSLIADILARADCAWLPARRYNTPDAALDNDTIVAILERRRRVLRSGVPYTARGTAAEAKATERRLNALQSGGYLAISSRGRVREVKLTPLGHDLARWITAEPLVADVWPWMKQIDALNRQGIGRFVRETDLARVDYGSPDRKLLIRLEYDLLPLKVAGLLDDTVDVAGRVSYGLTDAGSRALEKRPTPAKNLPAYPGPTWCDRHHDLLNEYEADRLSWRPDGRGEVFIPLPASGPPYKTWRDAQDLPALPWDEKRRRSRSRR